MYHVIFEKVFFYYLLIWVKIIKNTAVDKLAVEVK